MLRRKPKAQYCDATLEPNGMVKRFQLFNDTTASLVGDGTLWGDGFTEVFLYNAPTHARPPIRRGSFSEALADARRHYPSLSWDWMGSHA